MGYIIHKLRRDIKPRHPCTCDCLKVSCGFTANNYTALNAYANVETRAEPPTGLLRTYVAGPPCQGLSTAGLRRAWEDTRTRVYMQAIFAV